MGFLFRASGGPFERTGSALIAAVACAVACAVAAPQAVAAELSVSTDGLTATVAPTGGIQSLRFDDGRTWQLGGRSLVADGRSLSSSDTCTPDGDAKSVRGGVEWQTRCSDSDGHVTLLTERLAPGQDSIAWTLRASSQSGSFGKGIWTKLSGFQDDHQRRFWTTWGSGATDIPNAGWSDPLRSEPFADRTLGFGGGGPNGRDGFSVALASIMEPDTGHALTLVQSPDDPVIAAGLQTTAGGDVALGRFDDRVTDKGTTSFHMNLVPTVADWRPVLGWVVRQYPHYFESTMPDADAFAGVGSYSPFPGPFSPTLRKKLAAEDFRTNWELSVRGPYIGEFIPPVSSPTESWVPNLAGLQWLQSPLTQDLQDWRDVLDRWESAGYENFAYFNAETFGWNITSTPLKPQYSCDDPERWRNADTYLYCDFRNAIIRDASGTPRYVWQHSALLDAADPAFAAHLLSQAHDLMTKLPQYRGIVVDSLEHFDILNPNGDDGVAWSDGKPARSLFNSWRQIEAALESELHGMGKQVWANPGPPGKRIDQLKGIDGLFSEFSDGSSFLNMDGFLGLRRPVVGWLHSTLGSDPDAMLQHFLYMGLYPMGDAPMNDHGIQTSPSNTRYYEDYGPMFRALRGKRWDFAPKAVEVTSGQALANVFAVDGGVVVPVIEGGADTHAGLTLRGLAELSPGVDLSGAEYLLPGQTHWKPLPAHTDGDTTTVDVPLARGAAMVRFSSSQPTPSAQVAAGRPVGLDLSTSPDGVSPGHPAHVTATVHNRTQNAYSDVAATIAVPDGWSAQAVRQLPSTLPPGGSTTAEWTVTASAGATATVGELRVKVGYTHGSDTGRVADTRRLTAGELVPQSGITATASSADPAYPAQNLVDGDDATMWSTTGNGHLPQSVTLDLHGSRHLAGLTYLPRQDGSMAGLITDYRISTSSDGTTFTPVASGSWKWDAGLQAARFDAPDVRYVRLEALPVPRCFASALGSGAEINLVVAPAGWKAPPPAPESPPAFAHVVPHSQMTATATSAQSINPAGNAIDDDQCTFWHTRYAPIYDPMPQSITLDLGATYATTGLQYLPRQDGYPQGDITDYEVATSVDGRTFTTATDGFWDSTRLEKTAHWATTPARYVRITALYGYGPVNRSNGLASAADLEVGYDASG